MEESKKLQLNEEQEYASNEIRRYIEDAYDPRKCITISGPGGSGKTFMLKYALKIYDPELVVGATISHFAKKVLAESLGPNYIVMTVTSLLDITAYTDKKTGELCFKPKTNNKGKEVFSSYDIIIIDEASMIDDKTFEMILKRGRKIIFVGDKYQLPPVGQDYDSKAFDVITAELKTVMRFKGPLFNFSQLFVEEISNYNEGYSINKNIINSELSRTSKIDDHGSGYVFLDNLPATIKLAAQEFKNNMLSTDKCRVIAYKNKIIIKINNVIRKLLYGKNAVKFEINELIISNGGFGPAISNGSIFRVLGVKNVLGPLNIPCFMLKLNSEDITYPVYVIKDEGMQMYDEEVEAMKMEAKSSLNWNKYNNFVNQFASFDYSYAVNTHKVQGSTIENVYVIEDEIMSVKPTSAKEKFQSMYVAVTRAKHRVYIFNKKYKTTTEFEILKNRYQNESS